VLLAQPAPMPERLLGADPEAVLEHVFATWPADPAAISELLELLLPFLG